MTTSPKFAHLLQELAHRFGDGGSGMKATSKFEVVKKDGTRVPAETLREACQLAGWNPNDPGPIERRAS